MEIIVGPDEQGQRLDSFLKAAFTEQSRSAIQKAIRAGYCLEGEKSLLDPALKVKSGQLLSFSMPENECGLNPADGPLDVIWRDEWLAVIAKPPGLTVHPCPSCSEETLAHRLLGRFPELKGQEGLRPGIVHRLDKDTSGLLLVALTEEARLKLGEAFSERLINKEYLALVAGVAPDSGSCAEPIGRHPTLKTRMAVVSEKQGGKPAYTEWRRLWHNGECSLLAVKIKTGRTHQIRVHLASLGFPILGDSVYGSAPVARLAPRQMLHAFRLGFKHPFTGRELAFELPPPEDFFSVMAETGRKLMKIVVTGNQGCGKSAFCEDLAKLGLPTISADQIVADLYAHKSEATQWIGNHLGEDCLDRSGVVDKPALFRALQARPEMRHELERVIHGLVYERISNFFEANKEREMAVAEIPLYFESGFQSKFEPPPFTVGIECDKALRWQRIAANRGWSEDKIATMEGWQWPEARKMAACDLVIANNGSAEDLAKKARDFLERMKRDRAEKDAKNMEEYRRLCGAASHLRGAGNAAIDK